MAWQWMAIVYIIKAVSQVRGQMWGNRQRGAHRVLKTFENVYVLNYKCTNIY